MAEGEVLYRLHDDGGSLTVWARVTEDGDLEVQGQDIGGAVESLSGSREYEWAVRVAPEHHQLLRRAVGAPADLDIVEVVVGAFRSAEAIRFRSFLDGHAIPHRFWSRFGD